MNDYIAGLVGGTVALVVGHPLDTIKALMQTRDHHNTMLSSAKIVFTHTKVSGFFRGLALPFVTYGPMNSFLFGIYGNCLTALNNGRVLDQEECTLTNIFVAGTISGTLLSVPTNPLEVIRIQLQTHDKKEIKGLGDCIQSIYKRHGFRGYFKGLGALVLRDAASYGLYFVSFEYIRRKLKSFGMESRMLSDFIAGGMAGSISWFSIMPLDVIKSRIQANRHEHIDLVKEFKTLTQNSGLKGHFKGLSPVLIRGFLVNAVTLCVYIQTLNFLNKNF